MKGLNEKEKEFLVVEGEILNNNVKRRNQVD